MDTTELSCTHATHDTDECPIVGDITLEPGESREVFLGIYEMQMSLPNFEIAYHPSGPEGISASLERINNEDDYTLCYFIQNLSQDHCRVVIREF